MKEATLTLLLAAEVTSMVGDGELLLLLGAVLMSMVGDGESLLLLGAVVIWMVAPPCVGDEIDDGDDELTAPPGAGGGFAMGFGVGFDVGFGVGFGVGIGVGIGVRFGVPASRHSPHSEHSSVAPSLTQYCLFCPLVCS